MGYKERAFKYLQRKRKEHAESQKRKKKQRQEERTIYRAEHQKARVKALKSRARHEGAASAQPFGSKLERFGSSVSHSMSMMESALGGMPATGFDPITGAPLKTRKQPAKKKQHKSKKKGKTITIHVT